MRYLLLAVGLLGLVTMGWSLMYGAGLTHPDASKVFPVFFLASAIFFAAGAVGIDIVAAMKNRQ